VGESDRNPSVVCIYPVDGRILALLVSGATSTYFACNVSKWAWILNLEGI
jgi:hypothetical protein